MRIIVAATVILLCCSAVNANQCDDLIAQYNGLRGPDFPKSPTLPSQCKQAKADCEESRARVDHGRQTLDAHRQIFAMLDKMYDACDGRRLTHTWGEKYFSRPEAKKWWQKIIDDDLRDIAYREQTVTYTCDKEKLSNACIDEMEGL